jgi:hypothetical protein
MTEKGEPKKTSKRLSTVFEKLEDPMPKPMSMPVGRIFYFDYTKDVDTEDYRTPEEGADE